MRSNFGENRSDDDQAIVYRVNRAAIQTTRFILDIFDLSFQDVKVCLVTDAAHGQALDMWFAGRALMPGDFVRRFSAYLNIDPTLFYELLAMQEDGLLDDDGLIDLIANFQAIKSRSARKKILLTAATISSAPKSLQ